MDDIRNISYVILIYIIYHRFTYQSQLVYTRIPNSNLKTNTGIKIDSYIVLPPSVTAIATIPMAVVPAVGPVSVPVAGVAPPVPVAGVTPPVAVAAVVTPVSAPMATAPVRRRSLQVIFIGRF